MPLQIVRQDITKIKVDAVVNPTNEEMTGDSGVDFAVHRMAGERLEKECKKLAPLGQGSAKITKGYNLAAKYIIHTSGPVWQGGLSGESIILRACYEECLKLAVKYRCKTVAFPLISSGAYGYPKDKVMRFAIDVIAEFLLKYDLTVYLCVFDRTSYEFSKKLFVEISEAISDDYVEGYVESQPKSIDFCCAPTVMQSSSAYNFPCSMPKPAQADEGELSVKSSRDRGLEEYMKNMDKPFGYKLFEWIDRRGMTDVECYKKANVDKKTFSKIKCNPKKYRPSKQTAVAFAIALKLNFEETQDLLASAGMTLSQSFTFDKIIRYFLQKEIYDIFEINEALFEFDQVLLGC